MPDIVKNDKEIIKIFRKAAVDDISEIERKALRSRIDKSVTGRGFSRFYPWVAAASVILLLGFAYFLRHTGQNTSPVMPEMLVVQTQAQEKIRIVLPDSSVIWLNANSRLEYPDPFEEDGRNVTLSGEAYFDVVPDASRPFLVHTQALDVRVLGTTFNLTAYDNDTEVVTTLLEGKVGLYLPNNMSDGETIILEPDQQAVYRKRDQNFELHTVDTELYTSWIRGYYKFENTSFEQIAKQYGRLYDVTFVFEDEKLKDLSYTGTFLQAQDIESVLKLLRNLNDFQYKISDNQVYISY